MSEIGEYKKFRYVADCKCGDCQLVPTKVIYEFDEKFDAMVRALKYMVDNPGSHPANMVAVARDALAVVGSPRGQT